MAELPPPPDRKGGWYPDPEGSGRQRWWGGERWSERFMDAPAAADSGAVSTADLPTDKQERKRQQKAEKEERKRQQQADKLAQRRQQQADKHAQQLEQAFQKEWIAFWASPPGQARRAFDQGDHVFQYSIDVMNQQAIIVAMVGSKTRSQTADPTAVLNAVCREGWELLNGDFVFVMKRQQSRDKFMSSGQNVAVEGTTMGYYVFKRCESNRVAESEDDLRQRIWSDIGG